MYMYANLYHKNHLRMVSTTKPSCTCTCMCGKIKPLKSFYNVEVISLMVRYFRPEVANKKNDGAWIWRTLIYVELEVRHWNSSQRGRVFEYSPDTSFDRPSTNHTKSTEAKCHTVRGGWLQGVFFIPSNETGDWRGWLPVLQHCPDNDPCWPKINYFSCKTSRLRHYITYWSCDSRAKYVQSTSILPSMDWLILSTIPLHVAKGNMNNLNRDQALLFFCWQNSSGYHGEYIDVWTLP